MTRERLDVLVVNRNLFESREQAQRSIMAGEILVNDIRITKPGTKVNDDAVIRYTGKGLPYVSRGGLKLKRAIDAFSIDFNEKIVLDVGASTGGFTDCALKHGAKKVYSVDVGYGQLAWSLRSDPRVVVMERTNARELKPDMFYEKLDIITMDVSFISITKILPQLPALINECGIIITLIKPQFEAGKENVGKRGVVKDVNIHMAVIKNVIKEAEKSGLYANKLDHSPIKGPEGNIEFLLLLDTKGKVEIDEKIIYETVEASQQIN
ncbi:TlyA family RNA methyltransferase [Desulfitibacter alkalitolerans]|uniref:TlyA family RNA methyltransferase n=1 Tax=Desulfitibacter alkalitolerans TaxID=264641 RepID=UPI000483E27F|nr:TlyA family RNA methyltransferase [Desulfitibacter alkalitolerans]